MTIEQLASELQAVKARNAILDELIREKRKEEASLAELGRPSSAVAALAVATPLVATPAQPAVAPVVKAPAVEEAALAEANGTQKFGGLEFGIGLAFTYDLGHRDRIKEAEVVNNIVRAKQVENLRARIVLESHYMFTPNGYLFGLENNRGKGKREWGFGPFVTIQPGTDNVIEAVGAGLMLGFKRPSDDPKATDSFNVGIGVMYDLNAQVLGDGIIENQPLPLGETEVRFRKQSQSGLLVMTSYSF